MSWQNLLFIVITPLVLLVVLAVGVVGSGTVLLLTREAALEAYHVDIHSAVVDHAAVEAAALYPVAVALVAAIVILAGGMLASRLAPRVADPHRAADHH